MSIEYLDGLESFVSEEVSDPRIAAILFTEKTYMKETYKHSIRTAGLSLVLAKMEGYDKETCQQITRGTLVHDIGKMIIPRAVILKPDKLDLAERVVVNTHPTEGIEIIADDFSDIVKDIVTMHHEKLDGSGYPFKTKDIPEYVQLVTVADMYEAITSKRSYKEAFSHEDAIDILNAEAECGRINKKYVNMLARDVEITVGLIDWSKKFDHEVVRVMFRELQPEICMAI